MQKEENCINEIIFPVLNVLQIKLCLTPTTIISKYVVWHCGS